MSPAEASTGLPEGLVTFVLTDIEGSTALFRRIGKGYVDVLERHRQILVDAWQEHHGHLVGTDGDACFGAFSRSSDAVAACAVAQAALAREPWPPGVQVRVRMGIHRGLAAPREGNYVAFAVHQTARVASAAGGGQILVSADVAWAAKDLPDVDLVDLGLYRVRDFEEPVALFQAIGPGMSADLLTPRASPAGRHNLPRSLTPLIGRDNEVSDLVGRVSGGRLVTLTGPGGVGKSRLGLQVGRVLAGLAAASPESAAEHSLAWPDGVWLIGVAALDSASVLPSAILEAMSLRVSESTPDAVFQALRDVRAVLILDGCEHLLSGCAQLIAGLRQQCPAVAVLATSQEPIGLVGEAVVRLSPLAIPSQDPRSIDELTSATAADFFLERVAESWPDFQPSRADLVTIAEICRRLDGLPLALEIAAARVQAVGLDEMLDGLDQRFVLLRSSDPTLPARHRTLRALLEWSFEGLDSRQAGAMARLSLVPGPIGADAALAAIGYAGDSARRAEGTDLLASLVDRSLLLGESGADGRRYRLLESVRSFAAMTRSDDVDAKTIDRLAEFYLAEVGFSRRTDPRWVGNMRSEAENIAAVVAAIVRRVDGSRQEQGQRLASLLGLYRDAAGETQLGIDGLAAAAGVLDQDGPDRVGLLATLTRLRLRAGALEAARNSLDEASALAARVGRPAWDPVGIEWAEAELAIREGRPGDAVSVVRETAVAGLGPEARVTLSSLRGIGSALSGDTEQALAAFSEELAAARESGDVVRVATAESNVAEALLRAGQDEAAVEHQRRALALAVEHGMPRNVAYSLIVAAGRAAALGSWGLAVRLHAQAESILTEAGHALYSDDLRSAEQMMDDASRRLGTETFRTEVDAGRRWSTTAAVSTADTLLAGGPASDEAREGGP